MTRSPVTPSAWSGPKNVNGVLMSCLTSGKRNDDEDAKEKLYTYATHVVVPSFKVRPFVVSHGLLTAY